MTAAGAGERLEVAARLPADGRERLEVFLELLASDPTSLSSIRDPAAGWNVHVADSLSGLAVIEPLLAEVETPPRLGDVGAGAGFPGSVLAVAIPALTVDLIESVERKCEFMRRALAASAIANARVICERAETWARETAPAGGRDAYDVVTARAVGRLATLAELAAPLLREGGSLVVWKGRRNPGEEAELERAGARIGMEYREVRAVEPFAGARHRHLHLIRKVGPTPARLPRRPGMAKKRPLGAT